MYRSANFRFIISLFVVSFFLPHSLTAGNAGSFSRCIITGEKEGLSGNRVQSIVKDSIGTYWIGTTKGLDRLYEGKIRHYTQQGLLNRPVNFAVADRENNIWVSAGNRLLKYDYLSDSFENVGTPEADSVMTISYDFVSDGIVFNTFNGFFKYSYITDALSWLLISPAPYESYNGFSVMDDDTTAIVTTSQGNVYSLDLRTGERKILYGFGKYTHVKDMCRDGSGRVWIAVYDSGLFCLCPETGKMTKVTFEDRLPEDAIILSIQYHAGRLWLTTDGCGVLLMDPDTCDFAGLSEVTDIRIPEEAGIVNTCLAEDDGRIWLGTVHHGLIYLSPAGIACMSDDDFGSKAERGANRDIVSCMAEDKDGSIWIGTDGGGLYEYLPETGRLRPVEQFREEKIVSIEFIDGDRMLVSVYNKGIYRYDSSTGRVEYLPIVDESTTGSVLSEDIVISLKRHSKDRIYISARKIYEYDIPSGRILGNEIGLTGITTFRIPYSDSLRTVLYNSYEIYCIDHLSGTAEKILTSGKGDINNVFLDGDNLYIMQSFALSVYNMLTRSSEPVPLDYNGRLLPVMQSDRSGNLWIATRSRLIRLEDYSAPRYTVFTESDGYRPASFSAGVTLQSRSGCLYFGGYTGLCMINADGIRSVPPVEDISIVAVNMNGSNIGYDMDDCIPSITVPWNYESMYLDVTADCGDVFRKNIFRYTVNSRNRQTSIYSDSRLALSTLSPGHYSIDIAYKNSTDHWVDNKNAVRITVTPPWWQSIVFIGSLLVLLVGGTLLAVYIYHRREKIKAARIYRQRKEKLSESKLRFLTNISHELRTPLTLIYSPLKRLLEKNDFSAPVRAELTRILSQSKYMSQLINMVLDSRKLEEGYGKLNISSHNLNSWVRDVAGEFRTEYEGKNMILSCETDPGIGQVNFDEGKFRIILSNLIMNAWKYSESGTSVVIRTVRHDGNVRISVIDQGIGISGMDAESLFGRFRQGHSQSKGFGLGLSYTKLLVEAHPGGHIGAYANADKGSTFWFEIPDNIPCDSDIGLPAEERLPLPESDSGISPGAPAGIPDFDISSRTVLVAEDEPDLLAFLKRELSAYFREVYTAMDGEAALKAVRDRQPDIVVSDVMMPGMNGYELCRRIKNDIEVSHIPVVLLTAQAESTHRSEGYKSGADIFLTKPFDIPVLLAAIRNTLYGRYQIKEKYRDIYSTITVDEGTFSNADEQFLLKLDKFIAENISNDTLDAPTIIDHMCMGRATFYKKIKEVTGIGIMEYVAGKRMKIASELLGKSKAPVSEIALRVGYPDSRYFSRVFKQYYKVTPTLWREQNTSGEVSG